MLLDNSSCYFLLILSASYFAALYGRPATVNVARGNDPGNDLDNGEDPSRLQRRAVAFGNETNITEILSRFESITSVSQVGSTANSIKSLTYISNPADMGCKQAFNFTLAAIRSSEFILRAKLQLYLRKSSSSTSSYVVSVRMLLEGGVLSNASLMKEIDPVNDEYVEFEVADLLRPFLLTESHAVFHIQVHKFHSTLKSMKQLQCGEDFQFARSDKDQAFIPVLILFSHDQSLDDITYATIEKKILKLRASRDRSQELGRSHQRKRRSSQGCGALSLIVPTAAITQEMMDGTSFSIATPLSYDARICGGTCHYNTPRTRIPHALVLHLHLRLNPYHHQGYIISQCCLPASYDPLTITGSEPGAPIMKLTLENMRVKNCGCLDTATAYK